jgi:hypothetical protein
MENAKRIGCLWGLAVALGVGLAVANSPAVASAAPGNSGKGSSSGESSQSSHTPSAKKGASSATNDAPRHRRRDETAVSGSGEKTTTTTGSPTESEGTGTKTGKPGNDALRRGGLTSRPRSNSVPAKVNPMRVVVKVDAPEPTVRVRGLDRSLTESAATAVTALAAPLVSQTAAAPAMAQDRPVSKVSTPTAVDPVSHIVSTLVNAALSPFAGSAPTAPVQNPAAFTLLAFARREFEPSTIVNQPAPVVSTSVSDPDFISSTHDFFGLLTVTSAADPDDNHYVAFVISTPLFTNVLTSGTDPDDNLGFGAASIGIAGHTVNTFTSPFLSFSIAIPITDPFAPLFTELIRLGF